MREIETEVLVELQTVREVKGFCTFPADQLRFE